MSGHITLSGTIDTIATHYDTRPPGKGDTDPPDLRDFLCTRAEGGPMPNGLHTWTLDRARVTCPRCLDWLHA